VSNGWLTFVDLIDCIVDISFSKTVVSENVLSRIGTARYSTIVCKGVIDGISWLWKAGI